MPKNVKVGVRVVVTANPLHTATYEKLAQDLADALNALFEQRYVAGFVYCGAKVEEIMELQCAHCGTPWDPTYDLGDMGYVCGHCGKGDSDG